MALMTFASWCYSDDFMLYGQRETVSVTYSSHMGHLKVPRIAGRRGSQRLEMQEGFNILLLEGLRWKGHVEKDSRMTSGS